MDNSIVELRDVVDDNMIHEACEAIYAGVADRESHQMYVVPVLPDVMGDGHGTLERSADAYHRWQRRRMPSSGYMLVTHGVDWGDFTRVVDHFFVKNRFRFHRIHWVGIPRKLTASLGTRQQAIRYIQAVAPHVHIHLLGFSDDPTDDILSARVRGVRGIDSAVPVRYDGVFTPSVMVPARDPNWFDVGQLTSQGQENIRNVRLWLESHRD
jgi:hypothetical protein